MFKINFLKTIWFGVLCGLSPLICAAPLPDLQQRVIHAVTENAYAPLNFVDAKTGQGIGFEYDLVNEIAQRLNAQVAWHISSWETMIPAIQNAQFDMGMDGITINAERQQQVAFSDTYLVSEQFMLVRADETRFSNATEFAKNNQLLFGAQPGTTNFYVAIHTVLDGDEKNPRVKLFDTFGASVQALKSADVDSVLLDASSARGYIGANPGAFKLVGDALGHEEFGFIFPKNSDLITPINQAIAFLKQDGTLERLHKKWFFDYQQ